MPNFAQNSVVISSMATKKYIWAYFRRKSMDLGPKKYTSRIEVPCPTPAIYIDRDVMLNLHMMLKIFEALKSIHTHQATFIFRGSCTVKILGAGDG